MFHYDRNPGIKNEKIAIKDFIAVCCCFYGVTKKFF